MSILLTFQAVDREWVMGDNLVLEVDSTVRGWVCVSVGVGG